MGFLKADFYVSYLAMLWIYSFFFFFNEEGNKTRISRQQNDIRLRNLSSHRKTSTAVVLSPSKLNNAWS